MASWSNILVYADGRPESSFAMREAQRLAEHVRGKVTALDVLHYYPARIPSGLLALERAELLSLMRDQRREQLQEEIDALKLQSPVDVQVTNGNPAFELIRQTVRGKHDLIVKLARGRDLTHSTAFGTTGLHLVRKSPVPVLLVSPNRTLLEVPKVLCALELDDTDSLHAPNSELLKASRHLAEVYGAEIHVVHVVDQRRTDAYRAFLSSSAFQRFASDRHRLLAQDLEVLITAELGGFAQVHAHLLDGDPSDQLVQMLQTHRFSHLVIGSVTHLGAGHLMGGLSEDVLSRVDCSVLSLKPKGFVSPVESEFIPAA